MLTDRRDVRDVYKAVRGGMARVPLLPWRKRSVGDVESACRMSASASAEVLVLVLLWARGEGKDLYTGSERMNHAPRDVPSGARRRRLIVLPAGK